MNDALNQSKNLIVLTIIYNIGEGIVALYLGIKNNSTSLLGFGLDSVIEITASMVAIWGVTSSNENVGRKAEKIISYSFLALAFFILIKSSYDLLNTVKPEATLFGVLLAAISILVEGPLSYKKLQLGKKLNNQVLIAEAKETLFCLNLSILVILGIGLNYLFNVWYFDPISALLMIPWLFHEFKEHR